MKSYYKAFLDDIIYVVYKGIRRQEKGLGKCQVVYQSPKSRPKIGLRSYSSA